MKFDEYMHDSMKEIAQDVQPDPRMRVRVMNAVQLSALSPVRAACALPLWPLQWSVF